MLAGHYAAALVAKRFAPKTSLGLGFTATQLEDILWAVAILAGLEHARIIPGFLPASPFDLYDFPWTHGLVPACALAWLAYRVTKVPAMGWCALSHWFLDLIAHGPDLPIWRGGPYVGLGLWRSRTATLGVDCTLLLLGLLIYLRSTRARSPAGRIAVPALVTGLIAFDAVNIYGPVLPTIRIAAVVAEVSYISLAVIATWLDRFRTPAFAGSSHGPMSLVSDSPRAPA